MDFSYICNMSNLQLSISVEEQANSFFVYDCTGDFNQKDNIGGWGGTNPKITDITTSVIIVTPTPNPNLPFVLTPNQVDTIVITPTTPQSYQVNVYPDFPNGTDNTQGYEILPYMIDNANNIIPSGKCRIQWDVTGIQTIGLNKVPFTASTFIDIVFIKTVTCCVDKLQKQVNVSNFKDKKSKTIIELNNLLTSAENSVECGLPEQANGIIVLLMDNCTCVNC